MKMDILDAKQFHPWVMVISTLRRVGFNEIILEPFLPHKVMASC
jgi:hypothetical protein